MYCPSVFFYTTDNANDIMDAKLTFLALLRSIYIALLLYHNKHFYTTNRCTKQLFLIAIKTPLALTILVIFKHPLVGI